MAKVLVLYYSSYGHIETMAKAVAEGAREAGATVDIKRVPEPRARRGRQERPLQARPGSPGRHHRRAGRLRRDHRRHRHALWPHDLADGGVPRPGRRPVGARRAERQGRRGLHLDGHPARRQRDHPVLDHHQPAALRHGDRRPALRPRRSDDAGRITGGSPYGATTIAGGDGSRQPSDNELVGARYQGRKIAETAIKLHG
jgi:NAD(P)H dehydrogenase (quinone)